MLVVPSREGSKACRAVHAERQSFQADEIKCSKPNFAQRSMITLGCECVEERKPFERGSSSTYLGY